MSFHVLFRFAVHYRCVFYETTLQYIWRANGGRNLECAFLYNKTYAFRATQLSVSARFCSTLAPVAKHAKRQAINVRHWSIGLEYRPVLDNKKNDAANALAAGQQQQQHRQTTTAANQPTTTTPPTKQSTSQPANHKTTNQPTKQPSNHANTQPSNQASNHTCVQGAHLLS